MTIFKVDTVENAGENWLVADFGMDHDGKHYILTSDQIHASEMYLYSAGVKSDAELVCKLLNEFYESEEGQKLIRKRAWEPVRVELVE